MLVQFVLFDKSRRDKEICFALNRGIFLVFIVLYVLTGIGTTLNGYIGPWSPKTLKK